MNLLQPDSIENEMRLVNVSTDRRTGTSIKLNVERGIRAKDPAISSGRTEPPNSETLVFDLETVILNHVRHVLELNHGNKLRTACQLGVSRSTLYRMLEDD